MSLLHYYCELERNCEPHVTYAQTAKESVIGKFKI